ncbi:Phosphinothricin N-acetyltransferase [Candidatus Burkholderia brachyanthoides]|nr:Phosphinothricin N-acetyltransferase [Candidatus Burkholderia brachyanthoides]
MALLSLSSPLIRAASADDFHAIARIYSHYVFNALATFEETPPSIDEMRAPCGHRRHGTALCGVVAELDGVVAGYAGYAYASAYRPRSAHRHTIKDLIYVADGMGGRGIGLALLTALIGRRERGPWRQMIAVIANSGNAGSIALHARLGFKHGQWVDTVLMQRPLRADEASGGESA